MTDTVISYPTIWIYSVWDLTHIHSRIWWSEIKIIHFWKTITRQEVLISFRRLLQIKSQREAEKRNRKQPKGENCVKKHLSFHGWALSYLQVGWSHPRSLHWLPGAPAGPLLESTTSNSSSCTSLLGYDLQGAVRDGQAVECASWAPDGDAARRGRCLPPGGTASTGRQKALALCCMWPRVTSSSSEVSSLQAGL